MKSAASIQIDEEWRVQRSAKGLGARACCWQLALMYARPLLTTYHHGGSCELYALVGEQCC